MNIKKLDKLFRVRMMIDLSGEPMFYINKPKLKIFFKDLFNFRESKSIRILHREYLTLILQIHKQQVHIELLIKKLKS